MAVGTNLQKSKRSALLHPLTRSTNYAPPSITGFSAPKASKLFSPAKTRAGRERSEKANPERDADYGIHKVSPPLFYEVVLVDGFAKINERLRRFGRAFPRDGEVVQVAHLLHKRGRFYICHFKSLLYLDDVIRREDITMRDLAETLAAVDLLVKAGAVSPMFSTDWRKDSFGPAPSHVRDVSGDRDTPWRLVAKYTFNRAK